MVYWIAAACFMFFLQNMEATLSLDLDDEFRECGNGSPLPEIDLSKLQIISEEDGSVTLNGSVRFLQDYESPTRWNFHTEKLERGEWVSGLISRDVPNICLVLKMPHEPWYPYTRQLKQNSCPFRAGHEEGGKSINIGNYAEMLHIPASFIGDWRLYYDITATRNGMRVQECFMILMTISEI